jgi:prophage antirepressor-like protein
MSSVAIFEFENQNVETITLDNNALFNPYEIGNRLGMEKSTVRDHLAEMDEDERVLLKNSDVGLNLGRKLNNRGEVFVTESGMYMLIFVSRKDVAKKFKKWLAYEVLPEIRRTGSYNVQENRLVQNLMANTEALLGIRREEIAILQQESPNKKLSNLMIDCSRNG